MNKVKILKLFNGEYIIGEVSYSEITKNYDIENPRSISMMPTMSGSVSAGFIPVALFSESCKKHTTIPDAQVWIVIDDADIPKEVINGYNSAVSGIHIASANDISDLKSNW